MILSEKGEEQRSYRAQKLPTIYHVLSSPIANIFTNSNTLLGSPKLKSKSKTISWFNLIESLEWISVFRVNYSCINLPGKSPINSCRRVIGDILLFLGEENYVVCLRTKCPSIFSRAMYSNDLCVNATFSNTKQKHVSSNHVKLSRPTANQRTYIWMYFGRRSVVLFGIDWFHFALFMRK